VTAPSIESIVADGAVAFSADRLDVPALRIAASGAAKLRIDDLKAESLRLSGAGAVQVDVAGRVTEQSISLSGAGDYRAPGS
jgi:adhesin HecA-like repeat protein